LPHSRHAVEAHRGSPEQLRRGRRAASAGMRPRGPPLWSCLPRARGMVEREQACCAWCVRCNHLLSDEAVAGSLVPPRGPTPLDGAFPLRIHPQTTSHRTANTVSAPQPPNQLCHNRPCHQESCTSQHCATHGRTAPRHTQPRPPTLTTTTRGAASGRRSAASRPSTVVVKGAPAPGGAAHRET
jgi:hypothetical protein